MSCICIDTSALQRQWSLLEALISLDAGDAAARDGASTNPRPGAGCATNRRWWGGRGSEMEDATSPWTQPIAPSQELGLLKYGGPDQMTGKTLSPLGEGRIAEGSKLRVPLGEEGLRRRASTNPRPGAGSGKCDEDTAGVRAGAGDNTSPRPGPFLTPAAGEDPATSTAGHGQPPSPAAGAGPGQPLSPTAGEGATLYQFNMLHRR